VKAAVGFMLIRLLFAIHILLLTRRVVKV